MDSLDSLYGEKKTQRPGLQCKKWSSNGNILTTIARCDSEKCGCCRRLLGLFSADCCAMSNWDALAAVEEVEEVVVVEAAMNAWPHSAARRRRLHRSKLS